MKNYLRVYIWIFIILLFVITAVFLIFKEDNTLRNDLYNEGYIIDTTMQIRIEE